jgi:copper chaperone NosL
MTIADPRYAAQLVTTAGRVAVFDDIGCLASYVQRGTVPASRIHSLWVHPVTAPDRWLDARTAFYLERPDGGTPMASGIVAFGTRAESDSARAAGGGSARTWADLLRGSAERPGSPG